MRMTILMTHPLMALTHMQIWTRNGLKELCHGMLVTLVGNFPIFVMMGMLSCQLIRWQAISQLKEMAYVQIAFIYMQVTLAQQTCVMASSVILQHYLYQVLFMLSMLCRSEHSIL